MATTDKASNLLIIWSRDDRETALKMAFLYGLNAKKKGWWDEVQLCIWGPSARLMATDAELQEKLKEMKEEGVELTACKVCSDSYPGVTEVLEKLGVDVKLMGTPLTEMLKAGWSTLTL